MPYRKIGLTVLVLVCFSLVSFGQEISVEGKASFFRPSCSCFTDIYDSGLYYGGEVLVDVWKGVGVWAGLDYFSQTGTLSFSGEETKLKITPVFLGLQISMPLTRYRPYAGLGLGYFSYSETNPIGTVEDSNFGYIVLAGLKIRFAQRFFFDIRGSYSDCIVQPAGIKANLGGMQLGFGLGIEL